MTASAMQGDREKCLAAGMDDYIAKPVRPEDVRKTIEAWAPKALQKPATEPTNTANAPAAQTPVGDNSSGPEGGPVDMDRLMEFTDGSPDNLRELVELYLSQT